MRKKGTAEVNTVSFTSTQVEIVKAVLYFDIFSYPLTAEELFENSSSNTDFNSFSDALAELLSEGFLNKRDNFIMAPWAAPEIVQRRLAGNDNAREILPLAHQYARKVASYPFVESVMISGGLSKNYFSNDSDFDFFIVTRPGRLWICRTLLILRYKLLPESKKKFWCVNYFISSDALAIPDINRFTATELAFLVPVVNHAIYRRLLEENRWYRDVFPNKSPVVVENAGRTANSPVKKITEFLLGGLTGEFADQILHRLTRRHWRKKFSQLSDDDFNLQLRSTRTVCKRHTTGFQQLVLSRWEEKLRTYHANYGLPL